MSETINEKTRNNAIIAYLMLFISGFLLFNKSNKNVNNPYVRSHIKSSIVLHLLILLSYVVFVHYAFLGRFSILGIQINTILAILCFLVILFFLLRGVYNAYKGNTPSIGEAIKLTTSIGLDINNDNVFDEQDKLTLTISHIPFIGYIVCSKYNNDRIQNILKLNLLTTLIISLVYISGYNNVANLLMLIYIIYICFSGVYLFAKDELITLSLPNAIFPKYNILYVKSFLRYIFLYVKGDFKEFKEVYSEIENKENNNLEDKKIYRLKNWCTLGIIFVVFLVLVLFGLINSRFFILFIFPICFGIGMRKNNTYKMAYIYELCETGIDLKNFLTRTKKIVDEKRKEVNEVSYKVK